MARPARNLLADALMRPGVVAAERLSGQYGLQVSLAEDHHAVRSSQREVLSRRSQAASIRESGRQGAGS